VSGLLIAIDGPGGAGKTSVTGALATVLRRHGHQVLATTEPSRSALGELVRHTTDTYHGLAYACLIAADRYQHLETEVRPALADGQIVLCDRYTASSLVLQRLDEVPEAFLRQLALYADQPDLQVILTADPAVLASRIAGRGPHSRWERDSANCQREADLYAETATALRAAGVYVIEMNTTTRAPAELADEIAGRVAALASSPDPTAQ
jgi:dTMP kinase